MPTQAKPTSFMTEERRMIQDAARTFAMKEILPVANKLDPRKEDMPAELIEQIADMGYFGIVIPEEFGGLGLGVSEYVIIVEEFARAWMSVASILARGNNFLNPSMLSETDRARYLPEVARGAYLGAMAMSEPDAGSDVANISTRAERDGDDWIITGNKYWCTFADGADYLLVIARTSPQTDGGKRHHGLSAFVVDKPRGELPDGVSGGTIDKIGYFGWKTWELSFDRVRVPSDKLIWAEGRGFYGVANTLETLRAHTAARSVGLARGGMEDALTYAQERRQFGQSISGFQAIRFKLAKMATEIEAARQLMYHVASEIDTGRRCDTEAAMAKYYASEMSERVTSEALQIFAGAGYTTDFAVERHWRDARLTKIFEGTSEIQLEIISRNLLGRNA